MIPHRENHLVLDIANSESETELQGNRQIIAPYRGAVSYVQFTTDQRKPWYIQALRPDGSPLTFGYDVLISRKTILESLARVVAFYSRR